MKIYVPILVVVLVHFGCERIVEIETPYPEKAKYCQIDNQLQGHWQSDSIWILTKVDSLDSTFLNKRPTYYYDLFVDCEQDTHFFVNYTNYGGAVTSEVISQNFMATDSSIFVFDEFELNRDVENATLVLKRDIISDSTFLSTHEQDLNADQRTTTLVWFKKAD